MAEYQEPHKEHINKYKSAHILGVAEYMRERAADYGLDGDMMYAVGLLHDIGYLGGRAGHEAYGSRLLSGIGIDEDIAFAIENHGKKARDVEAKYGKDAIRDEFILLLEADSSVNARGYRVGFEGRLADIEQRYGVEHPAYETVKDNIDYIKEYQKERGIDKPYDLYHKRHNQQERG